MNYILAMNHFQRRNHIRNKEFSLLFRKSTMSTNMEPQITPTEKIHRQIEIIPVLKRIYHIYQIRRLKLCKNIPLIHN